MGFDVSGVKPSASLALGHQAALRSRVVLRSRMTWMMPLKTFLSSTLFTHRSLGNKGRMRSTCSVLSPNNWAITHLLLVLSWGSLSAEKIIPHMMNPNPAAWTMGAIGVP